MINNLFITFLLKSLGTVSLSQEELISFQKFHGERFDANYQLGNSLKDYKSVIPLNPSWLDSFLLSFLEDVDWQEVVEDPEVQDKIAEATEIFLTRPND